MNLPDGYSIAAAVTAADFESFARLALEYSQWLGVDLGFQAFERELSSLPGCYSSPAGCILLLQHQPAPHQPAAAVGCVAVRPLHTNHTAVSASSQSTPDCESQPSQWSPQQQQHNDTASTTASSQLQPGSCSAAGAAAAQQDHPPADLSGVCEMKRLWVTQAHKGEGLGRALAVAAVAAARKAGYRHMVLDTLDSLTAANRLYVGLGFRQRDAYYHNPLPGVVYWQLQL